MLLWWGWPLSVLVVSGLVYLKYFHPLGLFYIPYTLYARTRVGQYLHSKDLKEQQGKGPHSLTSRVAVGGFYVRPVAMLKDNYAFILIDPSSCECAVVDPSDAEEVLSVLKQESDLMSSPLKLTTVLTTHKHWDHAGGNEALLSRFPHLSVVGGANDNVPFANRFVKTGDVIRVGAIEVQCVSAPCHTKGHVLFLASSPSLPHTSTSTSLTNDVSSEVVLDPSLSSANKCLFTGDTLFIGGCGSFFEGGAGEMVANFRAISALDEDTLLFCGHEYTLDNLEFNAWLEPNNQEIHSKLAWAHHRRVHNQTTLPSSVTSEIKTNCFMRVSHPSVALRVTGNQHTSPVKVMAELRKLRDKDPHLSPQLAGKL